MLAHATRQFLLMDHGKFGKTALHAVVPLTTFERVIVDEGLDPGERQRLKAIGVRLEIAPLEA